MPTLCRRGFPGGIRGARYGCDRSGRPGKSLARRTASAKLAAGKLAFAYAGELGIECIWPRIFSVYGIYDKESSMIAGSLAKNDKRGANGIYESGAALGLPVQQKTPAMHFI